MTQYKITKIIEASSLEEATRLEKKARLVEVCLNEDEPREGASRMGFLCDR